MLGAYLYRVRKSLFKKPLKFLLLLLAIAMSVFMIFFPTLMEDGEEVVVRNPNLVLGGITLVLILLFDFMFYTGVKNGVVGFTLSDVNFHMAGPFSSRFNLIILVEGVITTCAMLLWVLSCQVAVLYSTFGVSSVDVVALLLGGAISMGCGYFISIFFGARYAEDEAMKNKIVGILIAVNLIFIGAFVAMSVRNYGSLSAFTDLGFKGIVAEFGTSIFSQAFPVAGWIALIYAGIVKNSLVYLIVGILLVVLTLVVVYLLYANTELDYYETAIANAQKVADLMEARKAGIDSDSARVNQKIKVGKESLKKGWGSSAFTHAHLLQNSRGTKLFFVNTLGITYRIITAIYMLIMQSAYSSPDDKFMYMVMGLFMMTLLNVVVFGGGKTVLEFNKPFIFMVPESASSKLFHCLLADLPEIIFDSILCSIIMWYFVRPSMTVVIGIFFFMVIFDYLCELVSLVEMRLFRSLGRFLLMFLRYIFIFVVFFISMIPGIVGWVLTQKLESFVVLGGLGGVIIIAIMLFASRNIIDHVEYEK